MNNTAILSGNTISATFAVGGPLIRTIALLEKEKDNPGATTGLTLSTCVGNAIVYTPIVTNIAGNSTIDKSSDTVNLSSTGGTG